MHIFTHIAIDSLPRGFEAVAARHIPVRTDVPPDCFDDGKNISFDICIPGSAFTSATETHRLSCT